MTRAIAIRTLGSILFAALLAGVATPASAMMLRDLPTNGRALHGYAAGDSATFRSAPSRAATKGARRGKNVLTLNKVELAD